MHALFRSVRHFWRIPVMAAATVAAITSVALLPAGPAHAQPDCVVVETYSTSWSSGPDQGGFVLTLVITNACDRPVEGWELALGLAPGHAATQGWNAQWSLASDPVLATNPPWRPVLNPGASISIGLLGTWDGGYADPVSCTVNGSPCDGGPVPNQPPQVSLTHPADGDYVLVPSTLRLAADASDPDGQVDRVEFYLDDELVGSVDTAPYQLDVPITSHLCGCTAVARAVDDGDPALSTDSAPVTVRPITVPPVEVIAEPTALDLAPGGSGTVTVRLGVNTGVDIDMMVVGDPGISVSPGSFTLDGDNWDTGVEVTVTAEPGAAGASAEVIATTVGGSASVSVSVTG